MRKVLQTGLLFTIIISALSIVCYSAFFMAPEPKNTLEFTFVVPPKVDQSQIVSRLKTEGYIRNIKAYNLVRKLNRFGEIPAGGYNISKNLNLWQIAYELTSQPPDMIWVTIPEGLRKEQIGERFAAALGWTDQDLTDWTDLYTRMQYDYIEGVYFPDTYLVYAHEKPIDVSQRMLTHFNEVFAPYMAEFAKADMLWTTGLKVASLIERETANPADMPLISGIIWNRLLQDMRLEIDATLQYAKGKVGDKWWSPVTPADKRIDSPYNTYQNKGLPPTPICNPGLTAIKAALNPAQTDCIFYLHDNTGLMHCAVTYQEHLSNIDTYLR